MFSTVGVPWGIMGTMGTKGVILTTMVAILSTMGDIMMHVGDIMMDEGNIMSAVGSVQYHGENLHYCHYHHSNEPLGHRMEHHTCMGPTT